MSFITVSLIHIFFSLVKVKKLRQCITEGELVPQDIVMKYVESFLADNIDKEGIILDGYPRDMHQVTEFETKVRVPHIMNEMFLYQTSIKFIRN